MVLHYPDRKAPPLGCWWYDEAGLVSHYLPQHLAEGTALREAELTGIHSLVDWINFGESVDKRPSSMPVLRTTITSVIPPVNLFHGIIRHWELRY
jgi:hypothetical protein